MNVRAPLLAVCLALLAVAPVPVSAAAMDDFVAAQKAHARELAGQDRLADALAVWRTLLPLGRPDGETSAAIAELERTIAARVKSLESRARQAYSSGRSGDGDTYMLKILALQPGHADALKRLRRSQSVVARRQQQEKSDNEYRTALRAAPSTGSHSAPLADPPGEDSPYVQLLALEERGDYAAMLTMADQVDTSDADSAHLLRGAHTALAQDAERRGDLVGALEHLEAAMLLRPLSDDPLVTRCAELRGRLSTDWYRKGAQLINSDLPGAIAALEKAVSYNPYNNNARRKLDQAHTLQRNLERIEGRD